MFIAHNSHDAIISMEDFKEVQKLLDKKTKHYIPPHAPIISIFEDKLKCGYCGGTFTKVSLTRYKCSNSRYNRGCIDSKEIKPELIEEIFVKCVKELKSCINECEYDEISYIKPIINNYTLTNKFDEELFKKIVKYVVIGNYGKSQFSMRFILKDINDDIFKVYKSSNKQILNAHKYRVIFQKFINTNIIYLDENRKFKTITKIKVAAKIPNWEG